jgi:hypothetical protein
MALMMTFREVPELQKRTRTMEVDRVDLRIIEDDILETVRKCIIVKVILISSMFAGVV